MDHLDVVAYLNELAARLFGYAFLALVVGVGIALVALGAAGVLRSRGDRGPLTA